ncbi:protein SUR2 [Suhomyces tanzawaensis NRRL Y-17324]|uniref:Protein SUR2 n=1 Tax=Suhomyces tanzawaensis NRRL Y-17324 TaxID=984487 RepID=A0A1E4SJQ4_9ASCO|nr:protein SUR2 [Suhomyces tanzawaensis NRRL Y-17324]ODV79734.1 protein SUR2 [Suhomyces tanzawaensis NRRL Y-17324]
MDSLITLTNRIAPPRNFTLLLSSPAKAPLILVYPKPDLISGIPDGVLALIAPVAAYWTYATIFHVIDVYQLAEKYRIHPSEEEEARNKAPLSAVLQDVVIQHIVQTVIGYLVYQLDGPPVTGYEVYQMWRIKHNFLPAFVPDIAVYYGYMYGWSLVRICVAFVFIDSWQYWLHRLMHTNRYLYRRFHSRHHRLYVPYAFGALYNDPVEGFLLDTAGTGLASILLGLSPRECIVLYTFATLKTVDDHCGYRLPYDLFQVIFPNNSIYHDIHHQSWGIKHNFSQPFFTVWDYFFGTQYQFTKEYKEQQQRITLAKYKEFLASKTARKTETKKEI